MRFLWRWGFYNVEYIGGSGDRGRDLLAQSITRPLPGRQLTRRWVIQCKRWRKPPSKKHLHENFAAALEHHPDYYLMIGTFTITSALLDWLESIRSDYPFDILVIGRDELEHWLECSPDIAYDVGRGRGGYAPYHALMMTLISDLGANVQPGPEILASLSLAMSLCYKQGHQYLSSLHLLMALNMRTESTASAVLETCGLPVRSLQIFNKFKAVEKIRDNISISQNTRAIMKATGRIASAKKTNNVDDIDLLAGMLERADSGAVRLLKGLGVDMHKFVATIATIRTSPDEFSSPDYLYSHLLGKIS